MLAQKSDIFKGEDFKKIFGLPGERQKIESQADIAWRYDLVRVDRQGAAGAAY